MNLLHISFNAYPSLKTEHATKQIWKELMKDFDEYHVLGRSIDQRFHTEREGKLWLHRVPYGYGNKSFAIQQMILFYYTKKYKINIMIAQCALLGGVAGTLCSRIYKIPILVEIHGRHYFDIMDGRRTRDRLVADVIRWVYSHATAVRALNPLMQEMLGERNIKANTVVVQNRANLKLFQPHKINYLLGKKIHLIAVGTFVPLKGHLLLIKLIKKLLPEYAGLTLTLVGGGVLLEEYRQTTEGYSCFNFCENIPQEEIVKLLGASDIFLHPSYSEAVPRAIIEAMAMGLPVVVSDAGMTTGLVRDGVNGMLFHAGDEDVMEQKVRMLLESEELREKLGTTAHQDVVKNYDWDKNFEKYRKVLQDLNR